MDADGFRLMSRQHFLSPGGTLEAHCKMDITIESSRIRANIDENYKKGKFAMIQQPKKCFIEEMHNMAGAILLRFQLKTFLKKVGHAAHL